MKILVEGVISFYMFICVVLMVFNVAYIARQILAEKRTKKRIEQWEKVLEVSLKLDARHLNMLKNINELTSFYNALNSKVIENNKSDVFYKENARLIQELSLEYQKHSPMEKAFFAYLLASLDYPEGSDLNMLNKIMLSYFDDSTVYCRENVLHALYAFGNPQAVEHGLELLNENDWYHNPKLIGDGLMKYKGDKVELVLRLWMHRDEWRDHLLQGVVQFASFVDDDRIKAAFYDGFVSKGLSSEVRFALIRYFGHHPMEKMKPVLIDLLLSEDAQDEHYAIAAASALAAYPGEESVNALIVGLYSRSWYIRRNAAVSLFRLHSLDKAYQSISDHPDRYAHEMLDYVSASLGGGK
ncbi:MAG: hypothetical protein IJI66_04295 [Erysipelotrichaceae bacterium]|nr:hypothetical protein [Erysipelotrichaceae bacterium]